MQRLITLLKIRSSEVRMVFLVAALFAFVELSRSTGTSAADALFFLRYGISYLPFLFIALGVTNFITLLAYGAFLNRFDKGHFFNVLIGLFVVVLLAERLTLAYEWHGLYPILWITVNGINALLGTLIWSTAGEVCDTRQAKRLFPLFVSAGIFGGLVGSLIIGPIARLLGTENLILTEAGLLIIGFWLIRSIGKNFFRAAHINRDSSSTFFADLRSGFEIVRRSTMLQLLAISAVLFSVLYFSVSFPFGQAASAAYPNEADLAGFIGLFTGLTSAITFIAALFIANRLYARIGVVNALLLLPLTYLGGFILFAVNFSLSTAVIIRLSQLVMLSGIGDGAYSTFFNVVAPDKRAQVRAFDSGVPSQIGTVLSGILLILGEHLLTTTQIFIMGMITAALCTAVIWRMRRYYADALLQALRAGRLEVFSEGDRVFSTFQGNAQAISAIANALQDSRPSTRRLAATILREMRTPDAIPLLNTHLTDPDAEVRLIAVRGLAEQGVNNNSVARTIMGLLSDPDPRIKSEILRVPEVIEYKIAISSLLRDSDLNVQAQAAALLLDSVGEIADEASDEAMAILDTLLIDPSAEKRLIALHALGSVLIYSRHQPLAIPHILHLTSDPAPQVRRTACTLFDQHLSVPQLMIIDTLIRKLLDSDPGVRTAAAKALRTLGIEASRRVLGTFPTIQDSMLDALTPGLPELIEPLHAYVKQKIAWLRELRTLSAGIPGQGRAAKLLLETLKSRELQTEQYLLEAIGLLGHQEAMQLVANNLTEKNAETRAAAVEVLDTLGDRTLAKEIVPLLDIVTSQQTKSTLESVLAVLLTQPDTWIQALTIRAVSEFGLPALIPNIRQLTGSADLLVQQTAHETLAQFGEPMKTLQTVSLMERILILREIPLFSSLPADDLRYIADIAHEEMYDDGAILCREGDPGKELFILVSGHLQVLKGVGSSEKTIVIQGMGEFIGEMAIIETTTRSATVRAEGEVRVLVINDDAFNAIMRDRYEVCRAVMRSLSHRLRTLNS